VVEILVVVVGGFVGQLLRHPSPQNSGVVPHVPSLHERKVMYLEV
jgi:hypothetical protein